MNKPSSRPSSQILEVPRPGLSARNKLMDILSRREHSELEVREKLKGQFDDPAIEVAIAFAKEKGWLPSTETHAQLLSEKVASDLKRRGKGPDYINQYLESKGLPPVKINSNEELEKALELVENKFFLGANKKPADSAKVGRFLASRGFTPDIVEKVIYDSKFKFSGANDEC